MADISKCMGYDCGIKETCYRFTAPSSPPPGWQAWFIDKPPINPETKECDMYWKNVDD